MKSIGMRRGIAVLAAVVLVIGAALPTLGGAAVRAAKATIGTEQIKNGAVTNAKIRRGSLLYASFKKGQVARASLAGIKAGGVLTGTYPNPGLAVGSVKAAAIATGAVGKSEIAAGAVGSDELAAGAVRASDIANGSIGPSKIAPNSIGKGQIMPGGVGASEIAHNAVGVSELAPLPGARAFRSASISIPQDVVTELPLTDATYNQGGVWSTAQPKQLTAPVAGVYLITASVVFQDNGSGTRGLWIVPAGHAENPYTGEQQGAVTQTNQLSEMSVTLTTRLAAGEAVAIAVRQGSGGDLQVLGLGQRTALSLQMLTP